MTVNQQKKRQLIGQLQFYKPWLKNHFRLGFKRPSSGYIPKTNTLMENTQTHN